MRTFLPIRSVPIFFEIFYMPASTPISRTKTAALSRILDSVPKGYVHYFSGSVPALKVEALAKKMHEHYGIGCTPAQRVTRKKRGVANAVMVIYWPANAVRVEWLILATEGVGLEGEKLQDVTSKTRLNWLGYEFVRHAARGRTSWTWRRPKAEMQNHFDMIAELCNKHHYSALAMYLQTLANQPGFNGVREQTWRLFQDARRRGYEAELPFLFYLQKISHGDRMIL